MSALPQPVIHNSRRRSERSRPLPFKKNSDQSNLPTSLQVLLRFQQTTSFLTLGVVGVLLGIYGWTVYTPVLWSQQYKELKALQKTERQLIANTEAIKHQLAQEAERPGSGLVNPNPHQNLFLPAQKDPAQKGDRPVVSSPPVTVAQQSLNLADKPVAY